ncbi:MULTISPECIES: MarR family transcriptional regulator [unclassified Arcicella]|uniref:MarR family winged helix-turn-helix transcriptional regulator n=1 Tax=unclassified Arcicella TaxID=2644986 RepID=UPI002855D4DB|nr:MULTISPECIES: MarR family transcriptional regulator [unclassified Arcicella]MDR6561765.1 DNA-binding MarR family transcriptional regulator [Arcicella sp. BE51]MDR6812545.1 DNA-binding MarR family transcriptional regulator [Arcicella sp. BE140]MDR6823683.1 DNA-binding MarR family transcriptional regulator [Arcicella sp. BE139]
MDILKLENQVCFPVYALSRHITSLYRPHLEKMGLTYPQYLVMLVLWEHHQVTVKELGKKLWLDSGTLTPLLKRLIENGLVTKNRSEVDERLVDITITEKGKALKEQALSLPYTLIKELETDEEQFLMLKAQIDKLLEVKESKNI